MKALASDNQSGVHPQIMQALVNANVDHAESYGMDDATARACALFREQFGPCETAFVFNGTAANVLAIAPFIRPHEAVICADTAHLHVDERGAPERFLGSKLLVTPAPGGKLTPAAVAKHLIRKGDQHFAQPRVISVANPTEYGTVYTPAELRALADFAHSNGLKLHIDGARFVNAAASLGVSLRALSADIGADALSFGGTKNGLMFGEAVVFFGAAAQQHARELKFIRKQAMQLGSKGRFIGAQFEAFLRDDLWKHIANHSNAMARRLADAVRDVPGVQLTQPVEANAVFAVLPREWVKPLNAHTHFYVWDEHRFEVRWMTSFDTTPAEIDAFAAKLRAVASA